MLAHDDKEGIFALLLNPNPSPSDCVQNLSIVVVCVDILSFGLNIVDTTIVDIFAIPAISIGCTTGGLCSLALAVSLKLDLAVSTFSPTGTWENRLGLVSFIFTAASDIFENHTTYITFDDVSGMTVNIGQDTLVTARNMGLGFVPEVHFDAYVSYKQLEYDHNRMTGSISATTGYSSPSIPTPKSISNNAPSMFWNLTQCGSFFCFP